MAQTEEQLRQKYQSAINLMQQLQVRLQNLHLQGEKLYIRGEAPSPEVKNNVWDQIKLIDPSYSDLTCDLTVVEQQQAAPAQSQPQAAPRHYTVHPGDSLSKISKQFYGDAGKYMRIFEANRNLLSDPNKIQPGQELVIPE